MSDTVSPGRRTIGILVNSAKRRGVPKNAGKRRVNLRLKIYRISWWVGGLNLSASGNTVNSGKMAPCTGLGDTGIQSLG